MFIPGDTIQHQFVLPFTSLEFNKAVISYKQNDRIVMEVIASVNRRENDPNMDISFDENSTILTYSFTQKRSLLFADSIPFTIQISVITSKGGSRITSSIITSSINGAQYYRREFT